MLLLSPEKFQDYELIDCGDFEKLERFGKYIAIRPEPQAVWSKKLSNGEWEKTAHVKFIQKGSNSGEWKKLKEMPDKWQMQYKVSGLKSKVEQPTTSSSEPLAKNFKLPTLIFKLSLTSFKHVGIFPEQAVNWEYIYYSIHPLPPSPSPQG